MSYTEFQLDNLRLDKLQIKPTESVKVSADVTNRGKVAGDEVVQLYIRDLAATVTRPVKELRGFKRVTLQPGAKQTVEFNLTPKDLEFLDRNLKPVLEPGEFQVIVGTSSDNGMQSVFEVIDPAKPKTPKIEIGEIEHCAENPIPTANISAEDDAFLEDLSKRSFRYLGKIRTRKTV